MQRLLHTASLYTQKLLHTQTVLRWRYIIWKVLLTATTLSATTPFVDHDGVDEHDDGDDDDEDADHHVDHDSVDEHDDGDDGDDDDEEEEEDADDHVDHDSVDEQDDGDNGDDDDEYHAWRCIPCTGESGHPVHQRAKIPCTGEAVTVGGIPTPLKNMSSSVGIIMKFPIYGKNKCSKPPTRYNHSMIFRSLLQQPRSRKPRLLRHHRSQRCRPPVSCVFQHVPATLVWCLVYNCSLPTIYKAFEYWFSLSIIHLSLVLRFVPFISRTVPLSWRHVGQHKPKGKIQTDQTPAILQ